MLIDVGTKVIVMYPKNEKSNNPAHKYDGQTMIVSGYRKYPRHAGCNRVMYTLEGAVSEAGKPYWFLEEEMVVM